MRFLILEYEQKPDRITNYVCRAAAREKTSLCGNLCVFVCLYGFVLNICFYALQNGQ